MMYWQLGVQVATWVLAGVLASWCGSFVVEAVLKRHRLEGASVGRPSGRGTGKGMRTEAAPAATDPAGAEEARPAAETSHTAETCHTAETSHDQPHGPELLGGGRTIGIVERMLVVMAILADVPSLIGVVVALKGLGRFADLRTGKNPAVAELFIVGSLTSLAWACVVGLAAKWAICLLSC